MATPHARSCKNAAAALSLWGFFFYSFYFFYFLRSAASEPDTDTDTKDETVMSRHRLLPWNQEIPQTYLNMDASHVTSLTNPWRSLFYPQLTRHGQTQTETKQTNVMASSTEKGKETGKMAFSNWRYKHYFTVIERQEKNLHVKCTLCPGGKRLSTSAVSNSNLQKHLKTQHPNTKLVAKNTDGEELGDGTDTTTPAKQQKLDFTPPLKLVTQSELNHLIGRYVVENMLSLATVNSDSFRAITNKIPSKDNVRTPCRQTFSK